MPNSEIRSGNPFIAVLSMFLDQSVNRIMLIGHE